MDGQLLPQTFRHESDLTNDYQYNTSVLSLNNLLPVLHMFEMVLNSTVVDSTLQFDYARYVYVKHVIRNHYCLLLTH